MLGCRIAGLSKRKNKKTRVTQSRNARRDPRRSRRSLRYGRASFRQSVRSSANSRKNRRGAIAAANPLRGWRTASKRHGRNQASWRETGAAAIGVTGRFLKMTTSPSSERLFHKDSPMESKGQTWRPMPVANAAILAVMPGQTPIKRRNVTGWSKNTVLRANSDLRLAERNIDNGKR